MIVALTLTASLLVPHAEVTDADWARAESAFEAGIAREESARRAEAAEALAQVPDRRAAKLLWSTARAQVQALRKLEGRDVSEANGARRLLDAYTECLAKLLSRLEGQEYSRALERVRAAATSRDEPVDVREAALDTLSRCEASEARDILASILATDPDRRIRVRALSAIAARRDPEAVTRVVEALSDSAWQVRAAAIDALVEIKSKRSIAPLIDALEREKGRLRDDVEKALIALTGQNFHLNATLWREWWSSDGPGFVVLGTPGAPAPAKAARSGAPIAAADASSGRPTTFYGIETRSHRVLFILDVSGSMAEPVDPGLGSQKRPASEAGPTKISAARNELRRALRALPAEATFNVIVYSSIVKKWAASMAAASISNREEADAWARSIPADGGTNIHDALLRGFQVAGVGTTDRRYESGADTIFFLSDGRPSVGRITNTDQILAEVRRRNTLERVVIHCVGVGRDADDLFLARLAHENGGKFVSK